MRNFINGRIATVVAIVIALLLLGGIGGAVAGDLISGKDVKDNSLGSKDVRNGSLKLKDLSPGVRKVLAAKAQPGKDGVNGTNGSNGATGATGATGAQGPKGDKGDTGGTTTEPPADGVNTNWEAKAGATILSDRSARLSNVGTPAGSSVEIVDLNLPVQSTKRASFTYLLFDGATYSAGSPRLFLEINGTFVNSFDNDPSKPGVDNGDGSFTKTFDIPLNGRIGAAGLVVDSGLGSVVISNVTIDGRVLDFR